jgi:NAD(P)-dependent dehydrogenase (short-subunit alcohol dehydrogenase family)
MTSERRTALVTGAASGIGLAIASGLRAAGLRVIGVDLRSGEIAADLGSEAGRTEMAAQAETLSGSRLDAVFACAGILGGGANTLSVNYFGAVATLLLLRPFLEVSPAPRAVVIGSVAGYNKPDEPLIAACLTGDETLARNMVAGRDELNIYSAAKTGLARFCRAQAIRPEWAERGILLNVVAPGLVQTGLNRETFTDPKRRAAVAAMMPCPLRRHAQPEEIASLALYLGSPENSFVTGQVIYADGGQEALQRGAEMI